MKSVVSLVSCCLAFDCAVMAAGSWFLCIMELFVYLITGCSCTEASIWFYMEQEQVQSWSFLALLSLHLNHIVITYIFFMTWISCCIKEGMSVHAEKRSNMCGRRPDGLRCQLSCAQFSYGGYILTLHYR